ncbi:acyl-CoA dehydrogenase family protein [Streptomyces lonegramiae]|uniref:Acyl-CoA dehydrogenase family protein n=2 Tax=Streptomyces TaxID=1883 RepID=A0ABU2XDS3_9ACTN|nr:acyl-CoA dehydrogenase family protein [Streptomyces sp. DSM 41529]MDT0543280.1 acyl-CoA dehydrogenase family protein [Streptomyces sp. DSM 41529]
MDPGAEPLTAALDVLRTARESGFSAALADAVRHLDFTAPCSGRGFCVLPGGMAPRMRGWLMAGRAVPGERVTVRPGPRHELAQREGLEVVRVAPRDVPDATTAAATATPAAEPGPGARDRLALAGTLFGALRAGLAEALLERAVAHVAGRRSGDRRLIERQLVRAKIADCAAAVRACELLLTTSGADPLAAHELHRRLDAADEALTNLFGGAGYLAGHPVRALYVSAYVGSLWRPSPRDPEWERS